ncbi:PAS domain-containing protein [Oceanispirochaeta crateris]|uniref:histidine kinase n=1 Tax=Oceanispirochaeta crateris TaxID=2518645 RepID=A0A5C1QLT2_9SPIO|nr:ATP-binding protein [Oceanispirochaeta crateris]QEN08288.1 PAS domain-containing protein [Oceanispirochaeta crateris]
MDLNQTLLSRIMNTIHDLVVVIDKNFRIEYQNQSFENFIQLNSQDFKEIGNQSIDQILPPPLMPIANAVHSSFEQQKVVQNILEVESSLSLHYYKLTAIPYFSEMGMSSSICILTNITNQELKKREYKQQNLFHSTLIKRLPTGVFVFDYLENTPSISLWNPRMESYFNITETEILGESYTYCFSEELSRLFGEALESIKATGFYYSLEGQRVSTPMGIRYFHIILNPIRDNQDNSQTYLCLMTDTTESVKQNKELEVTKQKLEVSLNTTSELLEQTGAEFSSIIDSSFEVSIFSLDKDLKYRFFNTRHALFMRETYGVKIKKDEPEVLVRDENDTSGMPILNQIESAFKGQTVKTEIIFHLPEGAPIFMDTAFSPLYDNGEITGVTALLFDATDHRDAMAKAGIFQTVADHAEYGVLILDQDYVIQYINPYWKDILFRSKKEVLGSPFETVFPEDQGIPIKMAMKAMDEGGGNRGVRVDFNPTDEEIIHTILNFVSYEDKSIKARGIALFCLDITAMVQAKNSLIEARDNAEKASIQKSSFVANMSHEFRTPLNAILGFSTLLKDYIADPVPQSHLESIINSSNVLKKLINTVLDFSKIEAGRMEIVLASVETKPFFQEVYDMFCFQFSEKRIDFEIRGITPIPRTLVMDGLRVQQIFINLINNALKFTHRGCVKILLKYNENTQTLIISIEDSGIGIATKDQQKIFDTFEQSEKNNNRKYEGTGLGLAITEKFITLMGGSIKLSSDIGTGCRFTMKLPLKRSNAETHQQLRYHQKISIENSLQCYADTSILNENMKKFGNQHGIRFLPLSSLTPENSKYALKIIYGEPNRKLSSEERKRTIFMVEHQNFLKINDEEKFNIITMGMSEIKRLYAIISILSGLQLITMNNKLNLSLLNTEETENLRRAIDLRIISDIENALPILEKCEDETKPYSLPIKDALTQFDIPALEDLLDKVGDILSNENS